MNILKIRHQIYLSAFAALAFVAVVYAANPKPAPTPEITEDESREVSEIVAHAVIPGQPAANPGPVEKTEMKTRELRPAEQEPQLKQVELL